MRRMYSEQELTNVIKAVFEQELADGALDEQVSDAVDAYLVENPVDITALEGQDVELASLDATGLITGGEIVEKMSGYSFSTALRSDKITYEDIYAGIVKNGNKLTLVLALNITRTEAIAEFRVGAFSIPSAVANKLFPTTIGGVSLLNNITGVATASTAYNTKVDFGAYVQKSGNSIAITIGASANLVIGTKYYIRFELTYLLSDNLIS